MTPKESANPNILNVPCGFVTEIGWGHWVDIKLQKFAPGFRHQRFQQEETKDQFRQDDDKHNGAAYQGHITKRFPSRANWATKAV